MRQTFFFIEGLVTDSVGMIQSHGLEVRVIALQRDWFNEHRGQSGVWSLESGVWSLESEARSPD